MRVISVVALKMKEAPFFISGVNANAQNQKAAAQIV